MDIGFYRLSHFGHWYGHGADIDNIVYRRGDGECSPKRRSREVTRRETNTELQDSRWDFFDLLYTTDWILLICCTLFLIEYIDVFTLSGM